MESRVPYNATGSVGPEPPPNTILIQLMPQPPCGNHRQSMPIAVQAIPLYLGHKGSIPQAPGNRWRQEMGACPSRRQPTIPYYSSAGSFKTSTYSDVNGNSRYSGQGNLAHGPNIRAYQISYPPSRANDYTNGSGWSSYNQRTQPEPTACCCPPSDPQANIYGDTSSYSQPRPSNQPHNPPLREVQLRSCDCFNDVRDEEIQCDSSMICRDCEPIPNLKEPPKDEAEQEGHRDQCTCTNDINNGLPDFDAMKMICESFGKAMMAAAMAAVEAVQKSQQPTDFAKNLDNGQAGMQFPEPKTLSNIMGPGWDSASKEEQTRNNNNFSDIYKEALDGESPKRDGELGEKKLDADPVEEGKIPENKLMIGEQPDQPNPTGMDEKSFEEIDDVNNVKDKTKEIEFDVPFETASGKFYPRTPRPTLQSLALLPSLTHIRQNDIEHSKAPSPHPSLTPSGRHEVATPEALRPTPESLAPNSFPTPSYQYDIEFPKAPRPTIDHYVARSASGIITPESTEAEEIVPDPTAEEETKKSEEKCQSIKRFASGFSAGCRMGVKIMKICQRSRVHPKKTLLSEASCASTASHSCLSKYSKYFKSTSDENRKKKITRRLPTETMPLNISTHPTATNQFLSISRTAVASLPATSCPLPQTPISIPLHIDENKAPRHNLIHTRLGLSLGRNCWVRPRPWNGPFHSRYVSCPRRFNPAPPTTDGQKYNIQHRLKSADTNL